MLWYKSWLDTRWRFLTGIVLLGCSAVGIVLAYPRLMQLVPLVPEIDAGGEIGRRIKEGVELAREYRGYVWSSWFRQTPTQLGTLFAVLLGSGGLLSQGFGGGGELFTLSLPVSRNRLLAVRAAAGLAELLLLALFPSLLIPLFSPAIGESYGTLSALVHGVCLFVAGAVFFSLALLLSTFFEDLWRPLLIALSIAIVLGLCESVLSVSRHGIFGTMSGEMYFRSGRLPWAGWLASIAATALMLSGAAMNFARRDF